MEEPMKKPGTMVFGSSSTHCNYDGTKFWFAGQLLKSLDPWTLGGLGCPCNCRVISSTLLPDLPLSSFSLHSTDSENILLLPQVVSDNVQRRSINPRATRVLQVFLNILGGPVIGKMTEDPIKVSVEEATSAETYSAMSNDSTYLGDYTAVDANGSSA